MEFSEKLSKARAVVGITQNELAIRTGISVRTIQGYEHGDRRPRSKHTYSLAKELHVSSTYLLDDACDDPLENIEADLDIFSRLTKNSDLAHLKEKCSLCLTSKNISQKQKDDFFNEILKVYLDAAINSNPELESYTKADAFKAGVELGMKIALTTV